MFTCSTAELVKTLDRVIAVVERSAIQPIYDYVVLAVSGKKLSLTAADSATHVTAEMALPKAVSKDQSLCVLANTFSGVLHSILADTVSVKIEGNYLRIRPAGDAETDDKGFKLVTRPSEEFPRENVSHKEAVAVSLPQPRLLRAIERLRPAIATGMHRAYLAGMYFDFTGKLLRLVATDGHRMGVDELAEVSSDTFGIIVPHKAVGLLARLLDTEAEDEVKLIPLKEGERLAAVRFEIPGVRLTSALIDGSYPDYMKVLPQENDLSATFVRSDLRDVLTQAATVLDSRGEPLLLEIGPGLATVKAQGVNTSNEAHLDLGITYEGEKMTRKFNSMYLTDLVKAFEGHELIEFKFKDGRESVLCEPPAGGEDPLKYVVMPVRN